VLAPTSSLASRGIDLPLVLDELLCGRMHPAAAMTGVLAEFPPGRQTLGSPPIAAVRRFESLGVEIQISTARVANRARFRGHRSAHAAVAPLRVVRETVGDVANAETNRRTRRSGRQAGGHSRPMRRC
jgi:hypothetical protein